MVVSFTVSRRLLPSTAGEQSPNIWSLLASLRIDPKTCACMCICYVYVYEDVYEYVCENVILCVYKYVMSVDASIHRSICFIYKLIKAIRTCKPTHSS